MIYLILLLIFTYPILRKSSQSGNINPKYYWFECLALIAVAGLRNYVGGDTITYMHDFENMDDLFHINIYTLERMSVFYRPLILALFMTCKTLVNRFFFLQIVIATIVNVSIFYVVAKESSRKYEVVFLYYLISFLYFNTEIMRESVAAMVFIVSLYYFAKKKWKGFYLFFTISFLVHDSVFPFIVLPFFHKFFDKKLMLKDFIKIYIIGFVVFNPVVLSKLVMLLPGSRGENFINGYGSWENASIVGSAKSYFMVYLYYIVLKYSNDRLSKLTQIGFTLFIILNIWGLFLTVLSSRTVNYVRLFSWIALAEFLWTYKRMILQKVLIALLIFNSYRFYFMDMTSRVSGNTNERYYFYEQYYPYYSILDEPDQAVLHRRILIHDQAVYHESK